MFLCSQEKQILVRLLVCFDMLFKAKFQIWFVLHNFTGPAWTIVSIYVPYLWDRCGITIVQWKPQYSRSCSKWLPYCMKTTGVASQLIQSVLWLDKIKGRGQWCHNLHMVQSENAWHLLRKIQNIPCMVTRQSEQLPKVTLQQGSLHGTRSRRLQWLL